MNASKNKFRVSNSGFQLRASLSTRRRLTAFTLVELLTVMAIIGVLAALSFPIFRTIKIHQYEAHEQAEMGQLTAAIDSYKAAYGFYPPDNPNTPNINQLYFELMGVTNNNGTFQTLDGRALITVAQAQVTFGTSGFMNCNKPGAAEDVQPAKSFLFELRPNQYGTNGISPATVTFLVASVGGPDANYPGPATLSGVVGVNPWRYNSSNPTNNPGHYDLWVQLSVGGKKYLISNWSKQVQINNPLP